jgi:mono/diheme cytochrome c family protein
MVERMRELGIDRPRLSHRETGDLIAFLYTLDYFDAPGDVDRGGELFRNKKCISCHQVGGDGGVVGPNLSIPGKLVAPIEIATAMWNHGSAMSDVMRDRGIERPRFTATELRDLIAFLESENQEVPAGPLHVLPGLAGDGRRLFSEKGCVQCHAVVGAGGMTAPDLAERGAYRSLLAFAAAMWNKVPAMTGAMRARGLSVPQLTPSEMGDLVGYLYSVKFFQQSGDPQRGRRQLRAKGCLQCHSLDGRGGEHASDLATVPSLDTPAAVIAALWNHALVDETEVGLASWPIMEPSEMADIAVFLQSSARRR